MEPLTAAQKETDAALRAWRQGVARDLKQPAFCVFADRVLRSIVVDDPQTPAELLEISGLGRAKVERWGDAILHAMRNGEPSTSLAKTAPAPKAKPVREKPVVVGPGQIYCTTVAHAPPGSPGIHCSSDGSRAQGLAHARGQAPRHRTLLCCYSTRPSAALWPPSRARPRRSTASTACPASG